MNKWFRVLDNPPPAWTTVLLLMKNGRYIVGYREFNKYSIEHRWVMIGARKKKWFIDPPMYWMRLPDPPDPPLLMPAPEVTDEQS